jgi:hypothetical protein
MASAVLLEAEVLIADSFLNQADILVWCSCVSLPALDTLSGFTGKTGYFVFSSTNTTLLKSAAALITFL